MTILEQLKALSNQFPNSYELAITPEQLYEYEQEMVRSIRYIPGATRMSRWPVERLPNGVHVQRTNVAFRNHTLTKVMGKVKRRRGARTAGAGPAP